MSEAMEWQGDNLLLTLERDPEAILVRLFPAKYAPRRLYVFETAAYRSKELERENAELRELVRAAWKCIHSGLSCSDCRLVAGGCTLESAMRELGVEVES